MLTFTDPGRVAVLLGTVRGAATAAPVYGEDARRPAVVRDELTDALGKEALDVAAARGRTLTDHETTELALAAIERRLTGS